MFPSPNGRAEEQLIKHNEKIMVTEYHKEKTVFQKQNLKPWEDYDLTNRKFKVGAMKKVSEERQLSELRNKLDEQKEYFTKEIKTLKKNQTEILKLKNLSEVNTPESTGNNCQYLQMI